MVAQLHALRAQQNKHLLGVEISERKHWSCLLRIERSQLRWFGVCPGCPKKYWQGKFCWLHPRESGPEAVQALGGVTSGIASPNTWGAKNLGTKMFDFRRVTLFCLEKRLSKHKMTIFSKNWGVWLLCAPWLRLWLWLHLRLGLALSWCGANRTIRNCWKPWGISSPKVAAPVTTPRRKLGMKIKQWMKVVWRQVSRFQRKPKFLESCMKVSKRSRAYPYDL